MKRRFTIANVFLVALFLFAAGCGTDSGESGDNNGSAASELSCDSTCTHLLGLCPDLSQIGIDQSACVDLCGDQMDEQMRECLANSSTCTETESCGSIDLTGDSDAGTDAGTGDEDTGTGDEDTGTGDEDTGGNSDENACGWSTACMKLPGSTAYSYCGDTETPSYSCCESAGTPPAEASCTEESRSGSGDSTEVTYCCAQEF